MGRGGAGRGGAGQGGTAHRSVHWGKHYLHLQRLVDGKDVCIGGGCGIRGGKRGADEHGSSAGAGAGATNVECERVTEDSGDSR